MDTISNRVNNVKNNTLNTTTDCNIVNWNKWTNKQFNLGTDWAILRQQIGADVL